MTEPTMSGDTDPRGPQLDIETLVGDKAQAQPMAAPLRSEQTPPTSLGGYEVLGVIGRGGMGIVYRAWDARLGRTVAIKRVLSTRAGSGPRERLVEEARQLARVQHEHVVEIFEVGEYEGSPYLVMEYVPGPSLQQWLRSQVRPPAQVRALLLQAGRGLAAAHDRDVVHLDFKPANILVAPGPLAKVADFGLAELFAKEAKAVSVERGADVTLSRAAGTPAYMAPEQFSGHISAKADQFAFAVSMIEALRGHRPFGSGLAGLLEPDDYADRLRSIRCPGMTRRAMAALRRACARDPDQRWPSLSVLLDVLESQPPPQWRTTAVFGGSLVSAGLAAWFAVGSAQPSPCPDVGEGVTQAWGATTRVDVAGALASVDLQGSKTGRSFILKRLDTEATSWAEQRRDVCLSLRAPTGPDDAALDQRLACLEASRAALTSGAAFAHNNPRRVLLRPQALLAGLPDVSACQDGERIPSNAPPVPPAASAEIEHARRTLVRALILHELEDHVAAAEVLADAETQLTTLSYPPLRAQLDHQLGSLALSQLDHTEAETRLEAAFVSANAMGMLDLACKAALDLAFLLGRETETPTDDADRWLRHAEALSERGSDHLLRRLALTRAALAQGRGDLEAALVSLRTAVEETSDGSAPLEHAKQLNNTSIVLRQLGRFAEAEEAARAGWTLNEDTLSATHPLTLVSEVRLANVLRMRGNRSEARLHAEHAYAGLKGRASPGELEASSALGNILAQLSDPRACDHLEESVELAQILVGPEHAMVSAHRLNFAGCVARFGDIEDAVSLLEQVTATFEQQQSHNLPIAQHALADVLLRAAAQRPSSEAQDLRVRAERISATAVAATVAARGPDTPLQAGVLQVRGRSLLELGRTDEALAVLRRVLILRETQPPEARRHTELLLQIARWETGDRDAPAIRLARDAEAEHEQPSNNPWVDGWLDDHGFEELGKED